MSAVDLTTQTAFRSRIGDGRGVIVISGGPTPVLHMPDCRYVSEEHFVTKVIRNDARGGRYWWFAQVSAARDALGPVRCCAHCVTAERVQDQVRG